MKRRTLRQLRPKPQPEDHHSVYVVLPGAASGKLPRSEVVYNNQKARLASELLRAQKAG